MPETSTPPKPRRMLMNFQVGPAYRAWLAGLTRHSGSESLTETITRACQAYASQVGYAETPPRRSSRPLRGYEPAESR